MVHDEATIIATLFPKPQQFYAALQSAFAEGQFVKVALRAYCGTDPNLKSIDIKPVVIKREPQLSFTWHYKTRDLIKNHGIEDALTELEQLLGNQFNLAQLSTTSGDWTLDLQGKTPRLKMLAPSSTVPATLSHDRQKARALPAPGRAWMRELGIADKDGKVHPTVQDKFRQINRYVEVLAPLLKAIPAERLTKLFDMGAGKGYLTFAVADYLANTLKSGASVVGVEMRPELVTLCNGVAAQAQLPNLSFATGTIESYDCAGASVLVALHACDTATDDAIAKGIAAGAELIVVAPCCHKQIRREMEATNTRSPFDFLTRHGIFIERQAEMVTDGIRALVLEYFGYNTKVFEFIADQHTPKNVMIVGTRSNRAPDPKILDEIAAAKANFGIRRHYLETATHLMSG
ncbi:MAG: SAM-dependent methyltransferase [Devosia sp.]